MGPELSSGWPMAGPLAGRPCARSGIGARERPSKRFCGADRLRQFRDTAINAAKGITDVT